MPKLRCHCQCEFEVSKENEIVECPECGRGYKNPFYSAPVNESQSNAQCASLDNKSTMSLKTQMDTPLSIVHGLSKSWLMLVLAITVTVTTVFAIIDLIPHLKGFLMYINIVRILFYLILCIGVWQIFINARANKRSLSGYKNVKAYISIIFTVVMLVAICILIIVFIMFGLASEIIGEYEVSEGITINTILIIAIFAIIAIVAVMSTFFNSIKGVLNSAQRAMLNQPITRNQSYLAAIILIIIGVAKVVIMCITNTVMSMIGTVVAQAASQMPFIGNIFGSISFESNWSSILIGVCGMLNYILGGVLLIIYSKKMSKTNAMLLPENI